MKFVKPLNLFKESLRRKAIPPRYDCRDYEMSGGFIGLNVGDNYVALAMSDPVNINAAIPLRALHWQQNQMGPMANKLKSLASKHNVVGFIVGYPSRTGKEDNDGALVTKLIDDLCKTGKLKGIKYTYWDGNITSMRSEFIYAHLVDFVSAHMALPLDISKETVDNLAAVPILQIVYEAQKSVGWWHDESDSGDDQRLRNFWMISI